MDVLYRPNHYCRHIDIDIYQFVPLPLKMWFDHNSKTVLLTVSVVCMLVLGINVVVAHLTSSIALVKATVLTDCSFNLSAQQIKHFFLRFRLFCLSSSGFVHVTERETWMGVCTMA